MKDPHDSVKIPCAETKTQCSQIQKLKTKFFLSCSWENQVAEWYVHLGTIKKFFLYVYILRGEKKKHIEGQIRISFNDEWQKKRPQINRVLNRIASFSLT